MNVEKLIEGMARGDSNALRELMHLARVGAAVEAMFDRSSLERDAEDFGERGPFCYIISPLPKQPAASAPFYGKTAAEAFEKAAASGITPESL